MEPRLTYNDETGGVRDDARWPSLHTLIETLREHGFKVGVSETIDASRLLLGLPVERPSMTPEELLRFLMPVLYKESNNERKALFTTLFDEWADQRTVPSAPPPPPAPPPNPRVALIKRIARGTVSVLIVAGIAFAVYRDIINDDETGTGTPEEQQTEPIPSPVPSSGAGISALSAWVVTFLPFVIGGLLLTVLGRPQRLHRLPGGGGTLTLDGWNRELKQRHLVDPLASATLEKFDRTFRGTLRDWRRLSRRPRVHVKRTVDATIKAMGLPQLRYRYAYLNPSYLVLVEADSDEAYAMLWAERMLAAGAEVDLRRIQVDAPEGTPLVVQPGATGKRPCRLDQLPRPVRDQRMVLVSDGMFLTTADGRWQPWVRRAHFERWSNRVLFSPREPRDLLRGPLRVLDTPIVPGDPGFLVLPREDSALRAWTQWLASGLFPEVVLPSEQRYPRAIANQQGDYWLQDHPIPAPIPAQVERLLSELHLYLGQNGFYWLCCCAVPPVLNAELTLLLGEEYFRGTGLERDSAELSGYLNRNYRLLSRLPWMQAGRIPDWLRLALLGRLPLSLQDEVRRVVERRFGELSPQASSRNTIELACALPRADAPADASAEASTADALYVGFMSGMDAEELALRVPQQWAGWLPRSPVQRRRSLADWVRSWSERYVTGGLRRMITGREALKALGIGALVTLGVAVSVASIGTDRWPHLLARVLFEAPASIEPAMQTGYVEWLPLVLIAALIMGIAALTVGVRKYRRLRDTLHPETSESAGE